MAYFAASCDAAETNKNFAASINADYPILSDDGCQVAKAYGVVSPQRKLPQRWTFYIDKEGKILFIDQKVAAASHGADIAAKLEELRIPEKK